MKHLLFGDNLKWLRDKNVFPDASVDLVYLDPPFNKYL
jgi:16S rRNA G966 N2-methylase RsmD